MFRDETFYGTTVDVDGKVFERCVFDKCMLRFSGAALPVFRGCRFVATDWQFVEAAATVLAFLSAMGHDFGDSGTALLKDLFWRITQQRLELTDAPKLIAEANIRTTNAESGIVSRHPNSGSTTLQQP